MIPTINLWGGRVIEGQESAFNHPGYAVVVCGHILADTGVNRLIRALIPYLEDEDVDALHRFLAEGLDCKSSDCPCYEQGVEAGYAAPRSPLGV